MATSSEAERAMLHLQAQVSAQQAVIEGLRDEVEKANDRVAMVVRMLIEKPEGDPNGRSTYSRIMSMVENYERASWLTKWLVRILAIVPTAAGLYAYYAGWFRG